MAAQQCAAPFFAETYPMPQITWKTADGATTTLDVADGLSLMEAARDNNIDGIYGDCGGNLACATCHVLVAEDWLAKTGEVTAMEDDMLEMVETSRQPNSRLCCQIVARAALDGLVVEVPGA